MGGDRYMRFARTTLNQLNSGDVVRVRRTLYWHYGVYCSTGLIVHLTTYPNHFWDKSAEVKTTPIVGFLKTSSRLEVYCGNNSNPQKTLDNAKGRIGERGYRLISNNCRHFALSCIEQ